MSGSQDAVKRFCYVRTIYLAYSRCPILLHNKISHSPRPSCRNTLPPIPRDAREVRRVMDGLKIEWPRKKSELVCLCSSTQGTQGTLCVPVLQPVRVNNAKQKCEYCAQQISRGVPCISLITALTSRRELSIVVRGTFLRAWISTWRTNNNC